MTGRHSARSLIGAALAAGVAVSVLAGPALAAKPEWPGNIDVFHCVNTGGESWPLAAGTEISGTEFWGTKTQGQAQQWINSSKLTVAFNGVPVANPEQYFQPPQGSKDGGWLALWAYPTGITLNAGQSITMYFKHELTSTVFDGFFTYPKGTFAETTCVGKARA